MNFLWRLWTSSADLLFGIRDHEVHDVFLRWLCFAIDHYITIPFLAYRVGVFSLSLRRFRFRSLAFNTFGVFKITVVTIICAVTSGVGSNYVRSSSHPNDWSLLAKFWFRTQVCHVSFPPLLWSLSIWIRVKWVFELGVLDESFFW